MSEKRAAKDHTDLRFVPTCAVVDLHLKTMSLFSSSACSTRLLVASKIENLHTDDLLQQIVADKLLDHAYNTPEIIIMPLDGQLPQSQLSKKLTPHSC